MNEMYAEKLETIALSSENRSLGGGRELQEFGKEIGLPLRGRGLSEPHLE